MNKPKPCLDRRRSKARLSEVLRLAGRVRSVSEPGAFRGGARGGVRPRKPLGQWLIENVAARIWRCIAPIARFPPLTKQANDRLPSGYQRRGQSLDFSVTTLTESEETAALAWWPGLSWRIPTAPTSLSIGGSRASNRRDHRMTISQQEFDPFWPMTPRKLLKTWLGLKTKITPQPGNFELPSHRRLAIHCSWLAATIPVRGLYLTPSSIVVRVGSMRSTSEPITITRIAIAWAKSTSIGGQRAFARSKRTYPRTSLSLGINR